MFLQRPRRNRKTDAVRRLLRETSLRSDDFVLPLFVQEGEPEPVSAMPGCYRLSVAKATEVAKESFGLGIPAVCLFPAIEEGKKNSVASESINPDGLLQRAIQEIKSSCPELCVITDVAMDPYSSDGHDGLVQDGEILNDESLEILANMAITQARAGADIVAPSDMMDGRVGYIREALDSEGFEQVSILSYAAKYASAFYGPFREALDSAPKQGDKKTYQLDPANRREAIREVELDCEEGADILMVKPALAYLDIISDIREVSNIPVAAYQVSGEYAMIKAAAANGWIEEESAFLEALMSIKRAGADIILTYYAGEAAALLS